MIKHKNFSYSLFSVTFPLIVLALVAGVFIYRNSVTKEFSSETILGSTKKSNPKSDNSSEKGDKGKPASFKEISSSDEVVQTLDTLSNNFKNKGKVQLSKKVEEISDEIELQAEETAEVIDELENLPKWKEFLVGAGYDNLGKLRSSIAHNTNMIRKINQEIESLGPGEDSIALLEQLKLLNEEGSRIQNIFREHESQFSILGWFTKFFTPVSNPEEKTVNQTTESSQSTVSETE